MEDPGVHAVLEVDSASDVAAGTVTVASAISIVTLSVLLVLMGG